MRYLNYSSVCQLFQDSLCECTKKMSREEMKKLVKEYQDSIKNIVNNGHYDSRYDFAVVEQPFLTEFHLPRLPDGSVDITYFSLDCMHLSTKGQGKKLIMI